MESAKELVTHVQVTAHGVVESAQLNGDIIGRDGVEGSRLLNRAAAPRHHVVVGRLRKIVVATRDQVVVGRAFQHIGAAHQLVVVGSLLQHIVGAAEVVRTGAVQQVVEVPLEARGRKRAAQGLMDTETHHHIIGGGVVAELVVRAGHVGDNNALVERVLVARDAVAAGVEGQLVAVARDGVGRGAILQAVAAARERGTSGSYGERALSRGQADALPRHRVLLCAVHQVLHSTAGVSTKARADARARSRTLLPTTVSELATAVSWFLSPRTTSLLAELTTLRVPLTVLDWLPYWMLS